MHTRNKLASAVASDTQSLASDDLGLTDTSLPGAGEPPDPGTSRDPHPSDPSIGTRENVVDLWQQLAKTNHPVPLLYIAAGRPVRLEYIARRITEGPFR